MQFNPEITASGLMHANTLKDRTEQAIIYLILGTKQCYCKYVPFYEGNSKSSALSLMVLFI